MIINITYLDASNKNATITVSDEQMNFTENMSGITIRPWPTALQFIPAHRIVTMFYTNCDADALDANPDVPDPIRR